MKEPLTLSFVCPAFEEAEGLPYFHKELGAVLAGLANAYAIEIIYVDDGSRDGTLQVIKQLADRDQRVRYISFTRNFGHQAALTAGLEFSRGDVAIMMDSDLQHPPDVIPALLEKWKEGHDIVLTVREEDPDLGWFKRVTSRAFYRLMAWISDTEIRLAAADFRLMSRRSLDSFLQLRETHRFLRGMVQWLGFPSTEVRFVPAPRKAGLSKYTLRRLLNLALDGVLSFSKVPLRLSMFAGLAAVLFGVVVAGYSGVRSIASPSGSGLGYTFLIASLYLMSGLILLSLSLIGEYIGRIYDEAKGRPLYIVQEQSPEGNRARVHSAPVTWAKTECRDEPSDNATAA